MSLESTQTRIKKIKTIFPHPFQFLRELVGQGGPSVARWVTVLATITLCTAILILTIASYQQKKVSAELTIVTGFFTVLIGYVYARGKKTEDLIRTSPKPASESSDEDAEKP